MRFSLPAAVVAAVTALTFATGCASEAPPVVIETPTPTATNTEPSASPTPTTPSPSPSPSGDELSAQELWDILPEGADIPDIRGATITARYFLQLRAQVLVGDPTALATWKSLSSPNCQFCSGVIEIHDELAAAGERRETGAFSLRERPDRAFLDDDDPDTAYVVESFQTTSWRDTDENGEVVREGSGEDIRAHMRLKLVDSVWIVDGVGLEEEGE